jgi:hypothetical protein
MVYQDQKKYTFGQIKNHIYKEIAVINIYVS